MPIAHSKPPSVPFLAGIFFTAMSVLVFQVALTRIFSIIMWHHHAYLVVSLALLGFGASGSLLAFKDRESAKPALPANLARWGAWYALAVPVSFLIVTRLHVDSLNLLGNARNLIAFFLILLVLTVPFLLGGLVIGSCLLRFPGRAGSLYCADLTGSALGALATPLLISWMGPTATVMAAAALACAGATGLSADYSRGARRVNAALMFIALVVTVCFSTGLFFWEIPFAPSKRRMFLDLVESPRVSRVYSAKAPFFPEKNLVWKWSAPDMRDHKVFNSAVAQVDVWPERLFPIIAGGEIGKLNRQQVFLRMVTQDGTGPTALYPGAGDATRYPALADAQFASAYVAFKAAGRESPKVLVIGVGGGIDVMAALFHGASHVTAVEVNGAMVRMVTEVFADYIGRLFSDPRVTLVNEDGRSFVNRREARYDIIQLTGVDTLTALASGAYTLSESYLYTTQAIQAMYASLKEGGIICYSRIYAPQFGFPRETLRLANTAHAALKNLGIPNPQEHIAVLQGESWASTMIRKGPFPPGEILSLEDFARREGFRGLVFKPGPDRKAVPIPMPLFSEANGPLTHEEGKSLFDMLLLGDARDKQAFVQGYPFNLEPPTDDKPFFFNYFKFSRPSQWWMKGARGEMYTKYVPFLPAGHMILTAALFLITLLAALFILAPLWRFSQKKVMTGLKLRTFLYFSALGLGFIFVEISLMQKFILFLGRPAYAISVVLAGILAFSGAGALFSARIAAPGPKVMAGICGAVVLLCLMDALLIHAVLERLLGLPLSARILVTLVILAPTGFVLGMPFPLGIRILDRKSPALIAWAWAINGFFTVLGSMLAIVIAMSAGFAWVLAAAAIIYVIGLLAGPAALPDSPEDVP